MTPQMMKTAAGVTEPGPEEAARRREANRLAEDRLSLARARLVLKPGAETAFFSALLLRTECQEAWWAPTMGVDGRRLYYNPDFVMSLSDAHLQGVLVHEVCHLFLLHHTRRKHRHPAGWNIAADAAVNQIVAECGFSLPPGGVVVGEGPFAKWAKGLSTEEYYAIVAAELGELLQSLKARGGDDSGDGDGDSDGAPDPGGHGMVLDACASEAGREESEREWKQAVAEAAQVARQRGTMPGSLSRLVEQVVHSPRCYREVLRRFLTSFARADHTWSRPNRRFSHAGLVLPSLRSESLGTVALNIDVSGSTWDFLERFAGEVHAIVEPYDCELRISYSDTRIQKEETWSTGDAPFKLVPVGGGGTDHACVFEWLAKLPEPPACLICLTDAYTGGLPEQAPDVPVLWVVVGNPDPKLPWGELVIMKD